MRKLQRFVESETEEKQTPPAEGEGAVEEQETELHESGEVAEQLSGDAWEVVIFSFGASKRPPHYVYTREAAERSLTRFDGARVYANSETDDAGHKRNPNTKPTRDIIGTLVKPRVTEADLRAELHLLPSAGWLKENLKHAYTKQLPIPYELSIDATGVADPQTRTVSSFDRVSVDVVERGAAGGKFFRMVASESHKSQESTTMKQKLLALFTLLYPNFLESKKIDAQVIGVNELYTHLLEADKPQARLHLPEGDPISETALDEKIAEIRASMTKKVEPKVVLDTEAAAQIAAMNEALAKLQKQQSEVLVESMLIASKLPKAVQEMLKDQFTGRIVESEEIGKAIDKARATFSKLIATQPMSGGLDVKPGEDAVDKMRRAVESMFMLDPNRIEPTKDAKEMHELYKDVKGLRSIKEAYIQLTGDVDVTGEKQPRRMTESLISGDWTNIISTAMNKRLVRDYTLLPLDTWRTFTDVVSVQNFKQQERVRFGGYANLPIRPEGQPYVAMTSPTDEKATYTPATRGGIEALTREMIINDDVASVTKIPARMARSAAQTLHEFVYEFIRPGNNPTIYDSAVLYVAGHANTATTALGTDGVALAAARLRMKKQTMKDSGKRLGIRARYLVIPPDLEKDAYANITPAFNAYNQVPSFTQQIGIMPIVVDYWTDATDWVLVADRADVVGLEVGFVNGQETPEMFVSQLETVGSWFTNDQITYKIRHEYGGAIVDFRAFDGSIVA